MGRYGRRQQFPPLLMLLVFASTARAQGGPPVLEFSFSNPGARSLALGGAFAALADDATAAFANPAGLVRLARAEVSVEGKIWDSSSPFTLGGRLGGERTFVGLDTTPGLRFGESTSTLSGLSFLSFVYPKGRWSLALYRHQLAKYEARFETQGFFATGPLTNQPVRRSDVRTSTNLDVVSYGLSGAYRLSDRFSVGFGVSYFDGELETTTGVFVPVEATLPEGLFGPNIYAADARLLTQTAAFDDTSWGWNGGFLWTISDRWSLCGFYRRGPRFFGAGGEISGPALTPAVPEGTVLSFVESRMRLPDVLGGGAAYQSRDGSVTVSLEWDHINYSVLIESLGPGVVDPNVRLDDGDELHVGLEYVFIHWTPLIALRGGTWVDPEHRIRYEGDDPLARAVFRRGETTYHYAFGFGLAWKRFQMDLGVDLSRVVDTASLSMIVSF